MQRIRWTASDPGQLQVELEAVGSLAPELTWTEGLSLGERTDLVGFEGPLPPWCAERDPPPGLEQLLAGARLRIQCIYTEATPMVPAVIVPIDPDVPIERRTDHSWHMNGDGSLCLLQAANDWVPGATAASLLVKASCWFVEYQLKERDLIAAMSEHGIANDTCFDALLASLAT